MLLGVVHHVRDDDEVALEVLAADQVEFILQTILVLVRPDRLHLAELDSGTTDRLQIAFGSNHRCVRQLQILALLGDLGGDVLVRHLLENELRSLLHAAARGKLECLLVVWVSERVVGGLHQLQAGLLSNRLLADV